MLAHFLAFIPSKYNQMTDIKSDSRYRLILYDMISIIQWEPEEIIRWVIIIIITQ